MQLYIRQSKMVADSCQSWQSIKTENSKTSALFLQYYTTNVLTMHGDKCLWWCSWNTKNIIFSIAEVHSLIWLLDTNKFNGSWAIDWNTTAWGNLLIVVIPMNCDLYWETDGRNTLQTDDIANFCCMILWVFNKGKAKI